MDSASQTRPLAEASVDDALIWALIEAAPDGLVVIGDGGTIELVNGQTEQLFGYLRSELLGRPIEILIPESLRDVHRAHRTRYRADPEPRPMGAELSLRGRRSDGTEFPVEVSLSPVDTGSQRCIIAAVRDVSKRLEAERRNRAVRHAIDTATDGLFIVEDRSLQFTYVNQQAASMHGYSVEEMIGLTPLHLAPELNEQNLTAALGPLLAGDVDSITLHTSALRKAGGEFPVEIHINHPPAENPGDDRPLVAIVRDITARVEAEQAVRASEEAFRAAFDDAPVAMAIAATAPSGDRPLLNVHQALCNLLGYSRDELLTKTVTDITHPDHLEADENATSEMLNDGRGVHVIEKRYRHADGSTVWAWLHSTPLTNRHGRRESVLAHIVDLTDKRRTEAERERERRRVQALAEIRASALADAPLNETLDLLCQHVRVLFGADSAFVARLDHLQEMLLPVAFDGAATRQRTPGFLPIEGHHRAALDGQPRLIGSRPIREGAEAVSDAGSETGPPVDWSAGSAMILPIRTGDAVDALLFVAGDGPDAFDGHHLQSAVTVAGEAATAIRLNNARHQQARIGLLEDRERLAEDLHDLIIQRLFAAGMGLQAVQPLAADHRVADRIGETVSQLDETISDLRSAIFNLNNPKQAAVMSGLENVIDRAEAQLGFRPALTVSGEPESISGTTLDQLLPTLTEALSNAARHAEAETVQIALNVEESITLTVADDGVGLDQRRPRGDGLDNIEARAERLGGSSTVATNPDGGTTLTWTVPF
ncbi:MAG: PAS domain S-box protein [Acidimicrobiales bacterium]